LGWRGAAPLTYTIIALIIWCFIHDDYGVTWDEMPHVIYGKAVHAYFTTSQTFAELNAAIIPKQEFYSPALDFICVLVAKIFSMDDFAAKHAVLGLLWVSMFWPVCRLGAYFRGPAAAWFSGLALLGMPSLYGHAFNNPKDLPLACATIWLLLAVVWVSNSRALRVRHAIGLGLGMGCVLMIRPGAWFLVALWGLIPLSHLWRTWCYRYYLLKTTALRLTLIFCGATAIAYACMISLWPHAQQHPIDMPLRAASFARKFDEIYPVLYRGSTFQSNNLPTDYLAGYLFFTLPIPIIAFFLIGQAVALVRLNNRAFSWAPILGTAFLIWFPLVFFYIAKPNIYDGMRHFLFMLPAVAVTAGAGASWLHTKLKRKLSVKLASVSIVALLLSAIPSIVRLHPYQVAYYNLTAGPNQTLHSRFETDYWISSFREAAEWINQQPSTPDKPCTVLVSANGFSYDAFKHYLRPDIQSAAAIGNFQSNELDPRIRYYVGMIRYGQYLNFPNLPEVHRIERDGVLMCVIRRNEPIDKTSK
jgi:hypothetical protein